MNDLQLLEVILRRIANKRQKEHAEQKRMLDVDTQELLLEIADELELASKQRK